MMPHRKNDNPSHPLKKKKKGKLFACTFFTLKKIKIFERNFLIIVALFNIPFLINFKSFMLGSDYNTYKL